VPDTVGARISEIAADIVAGRVKVAHEWTGEEFATPA
jgi:hypothetical protein